MLTTYSRTGLATSIVAALREDLVGDGAVLLLVESLIATAEAEDERRVGNVVNLVRRKG